MKKNTRNILGILFILLGIVGCFLPILQGFLFMITGYLFLDFEGKNRFEERVKRQMKRSRLGRRLYLLLKRAKRSNREKINSLLRKYKR